MSPNSRRAKISNNFWKERPVHVPPRLAHLLREEDRQSMVLSPCRNMAQAAMEAKERLVSSPAAPAKNTHRRTPRLLQDEFL